MKRILTTGVAVLFGLATAGAASAQQMDDDDYEDEMVDGFSVAALGGGLSPAADVGDGDFDASGSGGLEATAWLGDHVGLRATGLYAATDAAPQIPPVLEGEDPNVFLYSGDVVLRYPIDVMATDGFLQPYLVGGLGAKTYDFETIDTETDLAGNVGAGVEYRVGDEGRWGLLVEARDYISEFDQLGVEDTQHDIAWTAGVSLNF